jgi:hypothetical protein
MIEMTGCQRFIRDLNSIGKHCPNSSCAWGRENTQYGQTCVGKHIYFNIVNRLKAKGEAVGVIFVESCVCF